MSITASEARKGLFPLIKKVNEEHDAIEIVSRHGNAVLVSAEILLPCARARICCVRPSTPAGCSRPTRMP